MANQKTLEIIKRGYGVVPNLPVNDRTTSSVTAAMNPGEPVKRTTATDQYIAPLATGDPEHGTDIFLGITTSVSTETSAADGKVDVEFVGPGTQLRGFATTATNVNTAAKLLAIQMDFVALDITANTGTNGDFTVDEDEGDDSNVHGLMIVDGDIVKGKLDVVVAISGWWSAGV